MWLSEHDPVRARCPGRGEAEGADVAHPFSSGCRGEVFADPSPRGSEAGAEPTTAFSVPLVVFDRAFEGVVHSSREVQGNRADAGRRAEPRLEADAADDDPGRRDAQEAGICSGL